MVPSKPIKSLISPLSEEAVILEFKFVGDNELTDNLVLFCHHSPVFGEFIEHLLMLFVHFFEPILDEFDEFFVLGLL